MRLSLATRIFLGYAVVLVTFGAVSLFSITELHRNQVEIRLVSEGYLSLSQTTAAIETFQKNQAKDTERLREEDNVETRRALIRLARLYFPGLMSEKLDAAIHTCEVTQQYAPASEAVFISDTLKTLKDLKTRFHEYEQSADAAFSLLERAEPDWTKARERLDRLQQQENTLGTTIRLLNGSLQARILERVHRAQERERRTGVAIIALSVVAIVVGLLATGIAARSLRPVRTLTEGVTRISKGDYSTTLGIKGADDIAVLAQQFDAMARSLAERAAQLEQKQEQLLRAERLAAVGRISAQVAHEVRNPLSSIGLNVEMLEEHLAPQNFANAEEAKEARELLASVTRELDRLTEITEDYLKLARLPPPALRAEDLVQIVSSVVGFSREELERARVQVVTQWPEGEVPVQADEGQLRQVFLNLFRNSREAMPEGGTLTVRVQAKNGVAAVEVADTGPGIAEELQGRLFEPFVTSKEGGTGLGLSLSRQIALAHGGTLELKPGERGTTFELTLPRA